MNLARWIRRQPVPHALVCGDKRILIGDGHRRWADAVDAVFATDSETINAVDKTGTTLRVCQRADVDDIPEAPEQAAEYSDRQKELAQVAQIIADAYQTAHEQARETSARGYELLAKFAELSFNRLSAIEKAYGQLLAAHARALEAQAENAGENKGELDNAIGSMIASAMGAQKPPATPGNGASAPKKEPAP